MLFMPSPLSNYVLEGAVMRNQPVCSPNPRSESISKWWMLVMSLKAAFIAGCKLTSYLILSATTEQGKKDWAACAPVSHLELVRNILGSMYSFFYFIMYWHNCHCALWNSIEQVFSSWCNTCKKKMVLIFLTGWTFMYLHC